MASLTGQLVAETYKALLKTIDNDILTASEKQITDGFGGGSNVFIDSQGFLRANKYKVTNGLATQFLKADGSLDSNTYLTGITSSQIIAALGYTPVTNARTLTINGTTYDLSANRSWTIEGTAAVWGNISGTLSNQTDLQNALNAKFNNPTGTISQYIRGDGTLATLPSAAVWGNITGTLSSQTDLQSALDAKFDDPTGNSTQYIDGSGNLQTFPTMLSSDNLIKLVRNQSGATMTAGTIVYINGATGNKPTIAKALATSDATSAQTYGMVQADISNNADGYIVVIGNVNNLDTHSLTEGAQLYLSATTAGAWTTTKQYAPNHLVYVGIVLRSHPNQGIVGVKIQNGYEMDELHDVSAQTPSNNDGLFFETSTSLWKNKSIATVLGYTPQAQLSGTGFVKASGTTISYDNSTYLTTTDAASTYQRLDKMVSNLLASATEYPNSNAVIAALALKANAENPVFTGNMTISGAEPKLYFVDTDQNPDYTVLVDAGYFKIYDQTAGATRFQINSDGNISTGTGKSITAGSFIKDGGTASQFLKADGSIDSSTYVSSSVLADYLLSATAASTYQRLDKMVSNLLASSTEYPNSNAVIAALSLKADAANPVFTGNMTISGAEPKLYFTDTDQNPDYFIGVDAGYFRIYNQTAGQTKFVINTDGDATFTNSVTASSIIKSGGTSSQFLKADGTIDSNSYALASALGNYLPLTGGSLSGQLTFSSQGSKITFGDSTSSSPMMIGEGLVDSFGVDSDFMTMYFRNSFRVFSQLSEIGRFTSTGLRVYGSIIKDGGTSSQFLKADGSVDSNSYALASALGNYLPLAGGTMSGVLYGSSNGNFFIYNYGRIGLPNAGKILYNNGTGSNMFFGEISTDVYGFTGNLYSDTPTIAFNLSSQRVGIGLSNPQAKTQIYSSTSISTSGNEYAYALWVSQTNINKTLILGFSDVFDAGIIASVFVGNAWKNTIINADGGAVLLGKTSSDGFGKLQVSGNISSTGTIKASRLGFLFPSYTGNKQWELASDPNLGDGAYMYANGAGYVQSWFPNGNVGINTTTDAGYKFDVQGSSSRFFNNGSSTLIVHGYNSPYTSVLKLAFDISAYGANFTYNADPETLTIENYGRSSSSTNQGGIFLRTKIGNTTPTNILSFNGYTGASTFIENITITNVGRPYFIAKTTNSGEEAGMKIQQSTVSDWYFGTAQGTPSSADLAIRDVKNGRIPLYFSAATGACVFYGDVVTGGILTASGGINFISTVRMRWGGNNTPALGFPFGGSDTGNSLFIEAADGDTGGIAINNDGITVYGAADTGFVFRAIDEDSYQSGVGLAAATTFQISQGTNGGGYLRGNLNIYNGSAYSDAFYENSDIRLKKLIDGSAQVSGIENLEAKLYIKNGKTELGYFAQDAEKLMPYAVEKNSDGFLSLSYREVHTAKIARLEQRVAELEKQLNLN